MLVNRDGMGIKVSRVVSKPIEGDEVRVLPPLRDLHAEMLIGMAGPAPYPTTPKVMSFLRAVIVDVA